LAFKQQIEYRKDDRYQQAIAAWLAVPLPNCGD
jgi:hypothetical protein